MNTESALNEMLDELAQDVAKGVLLRNIERRLARHCADTGLLAKLVRIVEIRAGQFMAYAAR
ncbi:hypothetical protein QAO71_10605 [Halopseudomonas sp. SMJS2]|uniref:hypothetical protein n=1 Tax=Halopseudomonas sp. SMJS2 TaxID=3041098 RepID=UPI0024533038|nr:hypothetical protein [Halopseudomonas sp. SMJS2]WGK60543.1 hypothetical protein QAO71_10605 [Halopseudomonas sp. SMJS2]